LSVMQDSDKSKKSRRKKDKDAPKKPRSAYIIFLDRHRDEVRTACPDIQMKEITAALARQWQHVTDEERQVCKDIAAREKGEYEVAKKKYFDEKASVEVDETTTDKPKAKRAKKDKEAPKKGRSAFVLFLMEYRQRHSQKQLNNSAEAFADVSKQVGEAWAKLSAEEREPYLARAREEAAQYEAAKREYLKQKQARIAAGEEETQRKPTKGRSLRALRVDLEQRIPVVAGVDLSYADRSKQPGDATREEATGGGLAPPE